MALLFMDGFDHYATADIQKKWTFSGSTASATINASVGRFGGSALSVPTSDFWVRKALGANYATLIVGGAYYPSAASGNFSGQMGPIILIDGVTVQFGIIVNADRSISVRRSTSTVVATSAANVVPNGVWSYIELKATIHSSAGVYEVRVNGQNVLSGTGANTQATANAYASAVIVGASCHSTSYVDDVYICDISGAANNDFLGEIRIKTVMPTAEGTNTGWTPLSGTDNALMVDETNQDGDTTYNYTDTVSARDTYVIGDISALGGTVYGVAVNVMARKEGDVVRKIKPVVKSGATYALGEEATLTTSYLNTQTVHNTNPDTSTAWTETTVNAIEAGVDLTV